MKINNNGYDYVDLGLSSRTIWAACNVGAKKPTDYGLYFQFGDTQGYKANQIGIDDGTKYFGWVDYKFSINASPSIFSKYATFGAMLDLEDDAAHIHMGGDWHMPTPAEIQELIDNTTSEWTTQNGINGRRFTSKNGKSIFIPAAGYASNGSLNDSGNEADVWSSMLGTDDVGYGQYLGFYSSNVGLDYYNRYYGFSVRGVI